MWELFFYGLGRAEEQADVGRGEHGGVVERVTGGDDVVIQAPQRDHGALLLLRDSNLVAQDAVIFDLEAMTEQSRPLQLP